MIQRDLQPRQIAKDASGNFDKSLDGHFLANRTLVGRKVSSLLLSSSFGANALLYAGFLGYIMGLWGLIIQLAWMFSFFLLAPFTKQIYDSTSLHEFLEKNFGKASRRIAAICSIVGITYFAGWEVAVARSSLESVAVLNGGGHTDIWKNLALTLLIVVVVVAIAYTSLWGRKASGSVNLVLNTIKFTCLILLTAVLLSSVLSSHQFHKGLIFPSLHQSILNLTVMGLITNIIFNLSWQFVDNSSWQSISSASKDDDLKSGRSIKLAGLWTLLTVNGIGTLLGALIRGSQQVDSSNALGYIVKLSNQFHVLALVAMVILIVFSAMSLFDGAILSVSQAIVVDLGLKPKSGRKVNIMHARVVTLLIGVISAWGVSLIIKATGGSIFNFVYIVILPQLCLAGPVIVGLTIKRKSEWMGLAILISLLAGGIATYVGTKHNSTNLLQAAGTITTIVSVGLAYIISFASKPKARQTRL